MSYYIPSQAKARSPSIDNFCSSLQDMKMLKHLLLPRDMCTITSPSLIFIATTLTGLEHLELGFDYEDCVSVAIFSSKLKAICC